MVVRSGLVAYQDDLAGLLMPIDDVHPHPENYNNGDIDAIIASIEANTMYRPIYARKSDSAILAGNGTWAACKELGATEIPVIWVETDSDAIVVADNEIARLAVPDPALLQAMLLTLDPETLEQATSKTLADLDALDELNKMSLRSGEHEQWPSLVLRVPAELKAAFYSFTVEADTDADRLELVLRLAGWTP